MSDPKRVQDLSKEQMRQLAGLLRQKRLASCGETAIPRRSAGLDPLPLSFSQERLWFLDQLGAGAGAYNVPLAVRLAGRLDAEALRRTLKEIVLRHEALRTTFGHEQGVPFQVVAPAADLPLARIDLAALPAPVRDHELRRLARAEAGRPFDLARGPVLRASLLRLGEAEHVLLLTLHHIASDGWSLGVLVREIAALYGAFLAGRPSPLPELPVQYADYALWQRERLQGKALAAELAWWRERLAGLPESLDLPADRPRPRVQSFRGGRVPLAIGPEPAAALAGLAHRSTRTTLFMVLLAGFQALLARLTGQADLVVGSPVANRNRAELEGLVGMFVNTLALRGDAGGDPTFGELLERVRTATIGAFEHQELPFERVVEEVQPERDLGRPPIFQVMLVLQSAPVPPLALSGLELSPFPIENATAKFDLTVAFAEEGSGLGGSVEYSADLFEEATAVRLAGHLATLLAGAAADPGARLSDLPLLTPAETRQILGAWSSSGPVLPLLEAGGGLHRLFELQAARTPEAEALIVEEERLTYAQLDARASRLARRLRALGVGPESPVALLLGRSADLVAALLGVLKAGGAYVPLDPAYPEERIAFALEDTGAEVVLTQEALAGRIAALRRAPRHVLALGPADFAGGEAEPGVAVDPDHLAYVIYTSGSTGRPKGVAIRHGGAVARLAWAARSFRAEDLAGVLAATSICFDLSVFELFAPLSCGGRVVLAANALELPRLAAAGEVTLVNTVPSAMTELVRAGEVPTSVRVVNLAGEALPRALADAVHGLGTVRELYNLYGPSEDTTYSTWARVEPASEQAPSIGRPLPGTRAYLLDRAMRPLPAGIPGELHLAGEGLARGYLNRPETTAERFVPDPFAAEPGRRLYRTGDLARWRPDGEIDFLGRIDHQVKVRGFRIELGEVEAALLRAGVREAAVAALGEAAERLLVAYVAGGPAPAALRATLREALPEPMVPAVFVGLDALPRTPNGKVDRKALPAPDRRSPAAGFMAHRTPEEELLAGIWAGVLGLDRVGAQDDFFALGGHSLLATRVVSRVREAFQVELPVRTLFERPTVASLATAIEAARQLDSGRRVPPLRPGDREEEAPLSFAQERLWFLDQLEPGSPAYNMPLALCLRGELRAGALAAALDAVVERHEVLRTTFPRGASGPVQRTAARGSWPLSGVDLSALPEGCRAEELRRLAVEEALRPFDLAAGPLMRGTLVRLDGREHALLLTLHHAVCDGWSLGLLVREVAALYTALAEGRPSPLPPLPVQYADFAVWQRSWLQGEALAEQLAFWRDGLAGAPGVLELPADRPRPAVPSGRGGHRTERFPAALSAELAVLGRREGLTLFMTLLAAWSTLLFRTAEQTDLVVGTPIANRNRAESEELIGFFTNTLALRTRLAPEASFLDIARGVRERALQAYAHQDLPFERLIEELAPERSLVHAPLFQVLFALQNTPFPEVALPGLALAPLEVERRTAKFDLSLFVAGEGAALSATLEYASDLFDATTAGRLLERFRTLLEGVAADPEQRLADLPLLSVAERHAVLAEHNDVPRWQGASCVHRLVAARAERTPDEIAVVAADGAELSYAEVDRRADLLARRLRGLGVGPDDRVGVCLERSWEGVVALLGILKAGGCYLPLDPAYPQERLGFMLADAGAAVLVARDRLAAALPAHGARVLSLGTFPDGWPQEGSGGELPQVGPDHLSYVIYTSGSTGRPKGVALTHRTLANLIDWQIGASAAPAGRTLQFASPSFDVSLQEVFATWAAGGTLVLPAEEARGDADALLRLLTGRRVERLFLPFIALQQLAEAAAGAGELPPLREVVTAGEQLQSTPEVRALFSRLPGCVLRNQYGPSETHVVTEASLWNERPGAIEEWPALPSIGRPIAATEVHLLDPRGVPVPAGVPGEILLGGAGLARGYLGRPGLTAERFVPDPRGQGGRLYRTGDLARRRPSGELEFLGRIDHQVKVRGFRVELGEIEAALASHPAVREAVVVARGIGAARRLVAYFLPADGEQELGEPLRALLRERLPDYMVPAAFVTVERFPLTPSGKVDRRTLALTGPEPAEEEVAGEDRPRTPIEEVLATLFAEILGRACVGVRDSFFALGGHSLLATRLMARVRAAFAVEVPLRALFEGPTVEALAATVEAARKAAVPAAPPILPVPRGGDLPLSFAQQRLWFLDQMEPGSPLYNIPTAVRLIGPLDWVALSGSLDAIVARHEILRTTFGQADGEPVQRIAAAGSWPLPLADLSGLPGGTREAEALRLAREDARRPFDLAHGPVVRGALLRLAGCEHVLLLNQHHIVSDGGSVGVLVREVAALYPALATGRPSPLPPLSVQYADFAVWQREWLQGEVLEAQLGAWRERLAGAPVLDLPTDRPRPAQQTFRGAAEPFALPAGLDAGLRDLARRERATLFMILLGGLATLLARYSGQADLVIGAPVANRGRQELEGLIGLFVNTLPLRIDLHGEPSFRELIGRVRETALEGYAHQDVPFEQMIEALAPGRDLSRNPLFQAMLVFQGSGEGLRLPGIVEEPVFAHSGTAKLDLLLAFNTSELGLAGGVEWSADLFEAATVRRLTGHLGALLAAAAEAPSGRISDLPLLPAAERAQLLTEWNATAAPYPRGLGLHELFLAQAARTPGATALVWGSERLSYRELRARSGRLARRLLGLGVGPEILVGVCCDRTPSLVVALLAVLEAGGAYLPLDPAYPRERLAFLLADAGAPVLLTREHLLAALPAYDGEVLLLPESGEMGDGAGPDPCGVCHPEQLAYAIYTSGSTGTPKGVAIRHASAVAMVSWAATAYAPEDLAGVLASTSVCFDLSVFELFVPLATGGAVILAGDALELPELPAAAEVTLVNTVPSAMTELVRAGAVPSSVRTVNLAGEPLPRALADRLYELPWVRAVHNLYGPSEDTTYSTGARVPRAADRPPTIGRPLANTRVHLLDARLEPVPVRVPGELWIGGEGLARGYLGRPDLTADRFRPDPVSDAPGQRLYRTGDLARFRPDGEIEFLGRLDHQVKVRGFRIELGEIEAALAALPGLGEAVVAVRGDGIARRLVAYLVPEAGRQVPAADELRTSLAQRLPHYMVPAAFVVLESLPLTPNGKVDRRALPDPVAARGAAANHVAPRTPVEQLLAGIWAGVLGVDRVSVDDSFFDLGGHSLQGMRLMAQVQDAFGISLGVKTLFESPTVAGMALAIARKLMAQADAATLAAALAEVAEMDEMAAMAELD